MFGWGRRRESRQSDVDEEIGSEDESEKWGPFDEKPPAGDSLSRLDLGSVQIPVPSGAKIQLELDPAGPVRAVHMVTGLGRLTVSAFAAPRSGGLWADVKNELAEQLGKDGTRVRKEQGEWSTELLAASPKVTMRFIGVDGPRWLLRGVAAGPNDHAPELARVLYDVVRDTVVVRGPNPMPVRTPLPITLPERLAQHLEQAKAQQQQAAGGQQTQISQQQMGIAQRRQAGR
ncbi:DUF3710 domain-containing protein [Actinoalloteichus hymeniacidonis]|uniref:DUF3710 family protein n=1 Tax=Actinoalloteichus hymeniacidonis TaxID=340345 RepID=A0AAC9HNQ2_9PSEU|nr:DUF3710 domain-containing protein [Actinoalloteichus hymeniacidonis]AOS62498.1 putative DUF3710 family protein [Actinoalloteichus hymeniacidonis]MBB5909471.1 hypothetical protein [Actinoalloteichus hymeniacidonis]